jgi:serine/threonine-protein kinase
MAKKVTASEKELQRFVRGMRTAAKLHHPNIVQLYRAWQAGTQWWLAMEIVDGPSLRQVVAQYGIANMLSPTRVLTIARDIVAALQAANEHRVLHRNIRLDNILLTKAGVAKLSDFTLVRGVVLDTLQRITGSSELVGDVAFMAPERTDPDGVVDCRSDIYSFGVCLYSLLAGRPPFTGRGTVDLIERIRYETPTPLTRINMSVPGPLEGVVLKCLAKNATESVNTAGRRLIRHSQPGNRRSCCRNDFTSLNVCRLLSVASLATARQTGSVRPFGPPIHAVMLALSVESKQ